MQKLHHIIICAPVGINRLYISWIKEAITMNLTQKELSLKQGQSHLTDIFIYFCSWELNRLKEGKRLYSRSSSPIHQPIELTSDIIFDPIPQIQNCNTGHEILRPSANQIDASKSGDSSVSNPVDSWKTPYTVDQNGCSKINMFSRETTNRQTDIFHFEMQFQNDEGGFICTFLSWFSLTSSILE